MRRVACYSAASALADGEQIKVAVGAVEFLVSDWLRAKGRLQESAEGSVLHLPGGRCASVVLQSFDTQSGRCWECQLDEPTDNGRFLTRVVVGGKGARLHVFVELRAGGEALQLRPIPVEVRCPEVYRRILDSREWSTGAAIVRTKPIPFLGQQGAGALVDVIQHRDRNLPLILVSTVAGEPLVRDLAEGFARDLAGLAIVATANESVCWSLTQDLGREWSCYNQAVRMYWPTRGEQGSAYSHPLWTVGRLLESASTPEAAAQKLRNQLRRQLLALSTYTIAEPNELVELRRESADARLRELRERATESGEWHAVAEEYAADNDRLRKRLEEVA